MELLIGAGSKHDKRIFPNDKKKWEHLVTLDMNADHKPDVLHDLMDMPLPFGVDTFDEIHAYEVLEHTGQQGDYRFFFKQWEEFWRILKPGGIFAGTCPDSGSMWAWGDPGHTRIISKECFVFLDQNQYVAQVGVTPMSDYRFCYKADFELMYADIQAATFIYALRAIKPSRYRDAKQERDDEVQGGEATLRLQVGSEGEEPQAGDRDHNVREEG